MGECSTEKERAGAELARKRANATRADDRNGVIIIFFCGCPQEIPRCMHVSVRYMHLIKLSVVSERWSGRAGTADYLAMQNGLLYLLITNSQQFC